MVICFKKTHQKPKITSTVNLFSIYFYLLLLSSHLSQNVKDFLVEAHFLQSEELYQPYTLCWQLKSSKVKTCHPILCSTCHNTIDFMLRSCSCGIA